MSILINKDDNLDPTLLSQIKEKMNIKSENYTTASLIKQISPTVFLTAHNKLLPKMKINNQQELDAINLEQIKNKDNIETIDKIDEKIILLENELNKKKNIEEIDILQYEDEENEQRRLDIDKENLLKGFKFAFDPFDNCINAKGGNEEEEEEEENGKYELEYQKFDERLNDIFGI